MYLLPPINEIAEGNVFTGVHRGGGVRNLCGHVPCPVQGGRVSGGGGIVSRR